MAGIDNIKLLIGKVREVVAIFKTVDWFKVYEEVKDLDTLEKISLIKEVGKLISDIFAEAKRAARVMLA